MKLNIRLISAGAGTGKTYRLTDELTALLTRKVDAYHPSKIIATTFTRAAAAELKNRIREKILERGEMEIAAQLEQALIGTINSISQQLLSLFSFESGLSPALAVIDDDEKDVLFQESLSLSLDVATLNEMDKLAQKFSIESKDTREVMKSISDSARNNALDKKKLEWSRDDSIKSLNNLLPKPDKDQDKIKTKLQKIIPGLRKKAAEAKDDKGTTMDSLSKLDAFYYKLQNGFTIPWADWADGAKLDGNKKANEAKVFDEARELMAAHFYFPEFQNDLAGYIKLCFDAAMLSMEKYASLKKERGLVDFVDQESLLLKALDDKQIQKRFSEQFKVLFVDEFQDTSPLQLSLFLKISSLVEKIIWVGDSKQAIYGFRNSDAQLINTVTEALGKPGPADILQTSYRSRPELVDIVNSLFLPALQDKEKILTKEQIVLNAKRKENKRLQTAFQLWGFQWQPSSKQRDNNEKYQSHLATRVVTFLASNPLMEDQYSNTVRNIKAGDICILCRTNQKCTGIANALRAQGLQAVVSNTGLNLTAEWRLLKACLHLLVDETDSLSKFEIEFLTNSDHNVPGMLEERLLFLKQAGEDYEKGKQWLINNSIIQWINEHRKFLLSESISGIIRLMYSGLDFNRILMEWGTGAQRHANLQQILCYSTEFEDYCLKLALLPNVHGFLSWFDGLAGDEQDNRGLVTNEFSVNVFTWHAAKGLEWPVVILCDLDDEREPDVFSVHVNAKKNIDFKDPLKDRSLRYWPWPYKTSPFGQKSGFHEFIDRCNDTEDYRTLESREHREALRLLYVGFTRARDYLIIPFKLKSGDKYLKPILENGICSFTELGNSETDRVIVKSKLFNQPLRLWITDYDDYADEISTRQKHAEVYLQKTKKVFATYFVTPSGSKPVEDISFKEGVSIHSSFSDVTIDGEKSEFGTFIHRVFCAYHPGMNDNQAKDLITSLGVCYGFDNPTLQNELLNVVREFYNWVEKKFSPIKIYKELPLMMETHGQLIDGIADLVIETDQEIILIDYKTFIGSPEAMQWKATTFSGQLKLYLDILRQGFPAKRVRGGVYFVMKGMMVWVEEV
ncbi:MAG: UvrD-helicase domain-containing protein [Ginsengibacter sp.]